MPELSTRARPPFTKEKLPDFTTTKRDDVCLVEMVKAGLRRCPTDQDFRMGGMDKHQLTRGLMLPIYRM